MHGRDCAHEGGSAVLRADERNNRETEIHSDYADRARDTSRGAGALLLPPVQGVREGFDGMAMGIMGAAVEDHLDSGHAVGSVSGHLYASLPRFIRSRFVVPPAVSTIADYELNYQIVLHLALAQPNITYIGSPNPSTFLRLLDLLNRHRESLLRTLATGTSSLITALEPSLQSIVANRMQAMPARAAQLQKLPELTYANVWPDVKLLTTWTGGSCGIALSALRNKLPAGALVMESGLPGDRSPRTIPLEAETAGGLHHCTTPSWSSWSSQPGERGAATRVSDARSSCNSVSSITCWSRR